MMSAPVVLNTAQLAKIFGDERTVFSSKPGATSWCITQHDERLAVFATNSADGVHLSGTIIDHVEKKIVMRPRKLVTAECRVPYTFPDNTTFQRAYDGTVVNIIRYAGKTYYTTGRRLNHVVEQFKPDYKSIYQSLGGPSEDELFGDCFTYPYCYSFQLCNAETSFAGKDGYEGPVAIGAYPLACVETTEAPRFTKFTDRTLTEEQARALYNNSANGYPGVLIAEVDGVATRYESADQKWRQAVRGSNPDTAHRLIELIVACKITNKGIEFENQNFSPLSMKLVLQDYVEQQTPCVRYPLAEGVAIGEVIVYSRKTDSYECSSIDHFWNLVRVTRDHMKSAISPLKHAKLNAVYERICSVVGNIAAYYDEKMKPLTISSENNTISYSPMAFDNGYVPTEPRYTTDDMMEYMIPRHNESVTERIANWLLQADAPNFYHALKYFGSIDVLPPSRTLAKHKPAAPAPKKYVVYDKKKPYVPPKRMANEVATSSNSKGKTFASTQTKVKSTGITYPRGCDTRTTPARDIAKS